MIKPLGTRVLVRRKPEVTKTAGGLFIPDTCTEKPMEGIIMAIGDEITKVKAKDKVLFQKFAGIEIVSNDDGQFIIMDETEILGIL